MAYSAKFQRQSLLLIPLTCAAASIIAGLAGRWAARGTVLRPRKCGCLAPAIVAVAYSVFIVRWAATVFPGCGNGEACHSHATPSTGLLLASAATVALVGSWFSDIWLPATAHRLQAAEELLVRHRCEATGHTQLTLTSRVIAGLGTLEVNPWGRRGGGGAPARPQPQVIVLIHGLGAGNGLWCENIPALSEHHRLLCVEWRGCGRSQRPAFTPKTYQTTMEWMIPALEQVRFPASSKLIGTTRFYYVTRQVLLAYVFEFFEALHILRCYITAHRVWSPGGRAVA